MKSYNVFKLVFLCAIGYQFYNIDNTYAENNIINSNEENVIASVSIDTIIKEKQVVHNTRPVKYKLSNNGKDFIKKHETCVLTAYNDPDPSRRSIGWGHQIRPGENLEHITQSKADELFEKDIEWVNDAINRLIKQNDSRFIYSQGFIDGLGSLIYNCGEYGVTLTEFWARWRKCRYDKDSASYINESDFNFTVAAVKTSRISAKGHIQRRYNEHKLMLN